MAEEGAPRLDQRPDSDRGLRLRRYRLHSRGTAGCAHGQSDHQRQYDAQEQGPLQVSQDGRDPRRRVHHLLGQDGNTDRGTIVPFFSVPNAPPFPRVYLAY